MPAKQYRPGWQGKGYGTEYIKKARKRKLQMHSLGKQTQGKQVRRNGTSK